MTSSLHTSSSSLYDPRALRSAASLALRARLAWAASSAAFWRAAFSRRGALPEAAALRAMRAQSRWSSRASALRFELWRRSSGFPRPGFAASLPSDARALSIGASAMAALDAPWRDPECQSDWAAMLSAMARALAASPLIAVGAAHALSRLPEDEREGALGNHFRSELALRAPDWHRSSSSLARATARAPGLAREAEGAMRAQDAFLIARAAMDKASSAAKARAGFPPR